MTKPRNNADTGSAQSNPENIIGGELLKKAETTQVEVKDRVDKVVPSDAFKRILNDIQITYDVEPHVALLGLFATLQAGGTNKNKRSNVRIAIQNTNFESKTVNKFITKHLRNFTPRQFAVYFRDIIFRVSKAQNITGNAYVSLRRQYSHLLTEAVEDEKFWAADFQLDNENCPEYIRVALRQRYNDKFIKR
ncbi:MAG: hypothetical protein ABEI13_01495 [Candidatus Paceibacteria bacterium]